MKNTFVFIFLTLIMTTALALPFFDGVEITNAQQPTLVIFSQDTGNITTNVATLTRSLNSTQPRRWTAYAVRIRTSTGILSTYNVTLTIREGTVGGSIIYSNNYTSTVPIDDGIIYPQNFQTFSITTPLYVKPNINYFVTVNSSAPTVRFLQTIDGLAYVAIGWLQVETSAVVTNDPRWSASYFTLSGAVYQLAPSDNIASSFIQISNNQSMSGVTMNISTGSIVSDIYPDNTFGVNFPYHHFEDGIYYYRAGIIGNSTVVTYGSVKSFVIQHAITGTGNLTAPVETFNGTTVNGTINYPTGPPAGAKPVASPTGNGTTGNFLGPTFSTLIDNTQTRATEFVAGVKLDFLRFGHTSANIGIQIGTDGQTFGETIWADDANPVSAFQLVVSSFRWQGRITQRAAGTTYYVRAIYRGTGDTVIYSAPSLAVTTLSAGGTNAENTIDTVVLKLGVGLAPGYIGLCVLLMLAAFLLCRESVIARTAVPMIVLLFFTAFKPEIFVWMLLTIGLITALIIAKQYAWNGGSE